MKTSLKRLLRGAVAVGFPARHGTPSLWISAPWKLVAVLLLFSGSAQAQWLAGYDHRKPLAINAGVNAGTGYQIQVRVGESSGAAGFDLHLGGRALNFPNDVRFTDNDGTTGLGHWLESTTGSAPNRTATFWVKVNDDLNSSQSIFTYYRKSADASGSNGDATFSFFDDFPGASIDGAKWITDNATGWSVTGGELRGTNTSGRIRSQTAFNSGVILETKYRSVTRPTNGNMALGFWASTSDSFGWLNHPASGGGDYMRINSGWTGIANECNVPVIARMTVRATQVDFLVTRQDTGAVWHDRPNNNSTVSNERIALGHRYDNSNLNQTYNAFWDWVRVRKNADTTPVLGAAGAEQNNIPTVTLTAPANGSQVVSGSSATATATVTSGTPPYSVQFFRTFNGGAAVSAGTDNTDPYSVNLGVLADGSYTIYATVTDSASPTPATATSATHTFTVAPDVTPPSPSPMTFAVNPVSIGVSSIRMAATTATDTASPAVQYYFENTTSATNSGWISSPAWTESGLTVGTSYSYRVKARDSASIPNETAFSGVSSASPGPLTPRPITLVNPGFESPILADGSSTDSLPGWLPIGNVVLAAAWNPNATFYAAEAPEGQNIGDIFLSPAYSGFSQVLQGAEGQFQADTAYALKVRVGRNLLDPYDGYIIQLLANGAVIAQDDNSTVPAAGSFVTASFNYLYNASLHSHLVGFPLEIRLLSKGLAGGVGDVNFDDVQLTYATSNPVAIHGGPYRLSKDAPLALNGSGSLPSTGATITAYEWDLDGRNDHLGFIADVTGATPASIPYATLTGTYGMAAGANTIRLRITDNAGLSVIGTTAVNIFSLVNYVGPDTPRGQDEQWNKTTNWDTATVPSGLVDVVIPANKFLPCLSATTPTYTGNLAIGANSQISIGWTTSSLLAANSLGKPGSTVITMNSGSSINFRIGGTPIVPAIALAGDASVILGSSTQTGAQASFNHPITGSYRLSFFGNGHGSCVANLNAPNAFNEIYTAGGPYVDGGVTIQGNAPGSLGTGNLTLTALGGGGNSGLLIINAPNSMADGATLSMAGNTAVKITMNANDTISRLVINGVQLPAGTYGSTTSSASFKQTWMAGTGILTVTDGQGSYWDLNGATAGAGGASPTGTWDTSTSWSASPAGTAATSSWVAGGKAVFAAGSDATGAYTVTVGGPNDITVTNTFSASSNTGRSSFSATRPGWALNSGNCVVVLVSSLNATGFTATYAGLPMTVQGVFESRNAYTGIAYIISDSLPSSGDVVINVPRVWAPANTGAYENQGTTYSILSLSNVATPGTAATRVVSGNPPSTSTLAYSTSINGSFVVGVSSDSNWRNTPKTVTGRCSQIIIQAQPAYANFGHFQGSVAAAGSYTDVYNASPTAMITLPLNAKTIPNPLLSGVGQKISGLEFERGAVTITSSKLEMQATSLVTSASGVTATIASQITGLASSGLTKKGAGILVLSNATNNYTGPTSVLNGTLRLGASNAVPNTAVSLSGDAPGVIASLDLNGFNNTVAGLTFGGSSMTSGSAVTTGAGTLTLGGNVLYSGLNSPLGASLAGNLSLGSATRDFQIADSSSAANDLTVSAVISGTGGLTKTGIGTLLLSGNNAYTGLTTVTSGLLILSGSNNAAATGGMAVNDGAAIRFDSLGSIPGTGSNVTIQSGGLAFFVSSFGSGNLPAALARINPASAGVIAVDNFTSAPFNLATNGLNVSLGSLNDVTYTGTITPSGGAYRIGGGTGAITLTGANALTGGNSLIVNGRVAIANSNNLSGATTINPTGRLQIGTGGTSGSLASTTILNNGMLAFNRSDTLTQGTHFWATIGGTGVLEQAGSGTLILNGNNAYSGGTNLLAGTLRLGHANAIGSGPLAIYSGALDVASALTLTSNNAITLGGSFSFGGTANLNMGTGGVSITDDHIITLNGTNKMLTFGGAMTNVSGGDQTITVNGTGNTLVSGGLNMSSDPNSLLIALTIGGTGDVSITGTVNDFSGGPDPVFNYDGSEMRLGSLTKTGTGKLTLSGENNYTGNTLVSGGVLHLAGGIQRSPIIVNSGGTLGFTLGSTITSTKRLTLNEGHKIRIVGDPTLDSYTLMIADSIVGGAPTLETPIPLYFLEIADQELRLTKSDITPPVVVDITHDQGTGPNVGPIFQNTVVTYTVTFNEDIDHNTVSASDFANAAVSTPSAFTIGTIMEVSPGVFTVQVTPTTAGNLQLSIPTTADIRDAAINLLDSDPAIEDDSTIRVVDPATNWLVGTDIEDDQGGGDVTQGTLVTYTIFFGRDINHTTLEPADFGNAGTSSVNIGAVAEISPGIVTVQATPTTTGTLRFQINAGATLIDAVGNNLDTASPIVDDTTISVVDLTPPTLVGTSFVDNKGGGPVTVNTLVTYTVTFSEDMNTSTVTADVFGNQGTSAVTVGAVTETSPGVFSLQVTPTTEGTLRIQINGDAVITDVAGNILDVSTTIADDTTITVDGTAPTLAAANIVDDKSGGPVTVNTLVTYTVTFSEDMNASTFTTDDFGNAGTSAVTLGTITETAPGVFTVQVTPTTAGTLIFSMKQNAVLSDVAGNNLNTTTAITDDTTITVDGTAPTLAAANIVDDKSGGPVTVNTLVTYTVTFSEDMNASTVTADDFENAGTAATTIGAVTETTPGVFTVAATPTAAGTLILRVKAGAILADAAGNNLNTTSAITDNTTITVNGATGSYETWSAGAPFAGDANGDGVANALAWVLGAADPNAAAYALLPTFDAKSDPNFVIFTYRRTDAANNDPNTVITVQQSTALTSNGWGTAVHDGTNVIVTVTDNFHSTVPGIDRVEVKLRKSVFSPAGKLFVRLNVAPTP